MVAGNPKIYYALIHASNINLLVQFPNILTLPHVQKIVISDERLPKTNFIKNNQPQKLK
jgi:hypothetical protein